MEKYALATAGIVFALVAVMHLVRLYFQFPIYFGTTLVPLWVNVVGLVISAALSFWMFFVLKLGD